jgi:hypothetical protein
MGFTVSRTNNWKVRRKKKEKGSQLNFTVSRTNNLFE